MSKKEFKMTPQQELEFKAAIGLLIEQGRVERDKNGNLWTAGNVPPELKKSNQ